MKIKEKWKKLTLNEKLMFALIVILLIGIATRWRYVFAEVADAFMSRFNR